MADTITEHGASENRDLLNNFLKMGSADASEMNKDKFRSAVANVAMELSPDGSEIKGKNEFGEVSMRWARDTSLQETKPACIFMEGKKDGQFTSISLPVTNWGEGKPGSALLFSMIGGGAGAIHINNSLDIATEVDSEKIKKATEGVKWVVENLLNWNSGTPGLPEKI